MKLNIEEWSLHPQARMIPKSVFFNDELFDCVLNKFELAILKMDESNVLGYLRDNKGGILGNRLSKRTWLTVAFKTTLGSNELLLIARDELKLSTEELLNLTIITGRYELFIELLESPLFLKDTKHLISEHHLNLAIRYGHLTITQKIVSLLTAKHSDMSPILDTISFAYPVLENQPALVDFLFKLWLENKSKVPKIPHYSFSCHLLDPISKGHFEMLKKLLECMEISNQKISNAWPRIYFLFAEAVNSKHFEIAHFLIDLAEKEGLTEELITGDDCAALTAALNTGHFEIVKRLITMGIHLHLTEAMFSNTYRLFYPAVVHGKNIELLFFLLDIAQQYKLDMRSILFVGGGHFFELAINEGHLHLLNRLIDLAESSSIKFETFYKNFTGWDWYFRTAFVRNHHSIVKRLLNFPQIFAYFEANDTQYVHAFIETKMALLRDRKQNQPFSADEAKLYYYILRHFIRLNDPKWLEQINLILNIPTVLAMTHTGISPSPDDELCRMALVNGHPLVAERLLTIPEVGRLATQHNYYQDEIKTKLQAIEDGKIKRFVMPDYRNALYKKDLDLLEAIIKFKYGISNRRTKKECALFLACKLGNLDAVQFLIEREGLSPTLEVWHLDYAVFKGASIIHLAITSGHEDIVKYLVSQIEEGDRYIYERNIDILANFATQKEQYSIQASLERIKRGEARTTPALPSIEPIMFSGDQYYSPKALELVKQFNHEDVIGITIHLQLKVKNDLSRLTYDEFAELITDGALVNHIDLFGDTILHNMLGILLNTQRNEAHGLFPSGDPNVINKIFHLLKCLMDNGADPTILNEEGISPISMAHGQALAILQRKDIELEPLPAPSSLKKKEELSVVFFKSV